MNCSECGRRVPARKTGRPRFTCSARCARRRDARAKREARRKSQAAAENLLVASQREFRHWARTGEQLERKLTHEELLRDWLHHRCPACRRGR